MTSRHKFEPPPLPRETADVVTGLLRDALAAGPVLLSVSGNTRLLRTTIPQLCAAVDGRWKIVDATDPARVASGRKQMSDSAVTAAVTAVGAGAAIVNPAAGLIAALADFGWRGLRQRARSSSQPVGDQSLYDTYWDLLDAVASLSPAVVVLRMEDEASRRPLEVMLRAWLSRRAAEAPAALAIIAEAPVITDSDQPVVRTLHVPYLDSTRVCDWLGNVDQDLAELLVIACGGDDVAAADRWNKWARRGFVHQTASGWNVSADQHDELIRAVERGLSEAATVRELEIARSLLEAASFLGDRFNLEIVLASSPDLDPEEAEEALDRLASREGPGALIKSTGSTAYSLDEQERYSWAYEWVLPLVREQFMRDGRRRHDQGVGMCERMLERGVQLLAIDDLHSTVKPQVHLLMRICGARHLEGVTRHGGISAERREWWRWIIRSSDVLKDDAELALVAAAEARSARSLGVYSTAARLADIACSNAGPLSAERRASLHLDMARVLVHAGESQRAVDWLTPALEWFATEAGSADEDGHAAKLRFAESQHVLASAKRITGHAAEVVALASQALENLEDDRGDSRWLQERASCLATRAYAERKLGRHDAALEDARVATSTFRRCIGRLPLAEEEVAAAIARFPRVVQQATEPGWPQSVQEYRPIFEADQLRNLSSYVYLLSLAFEGVDQLDLADEQARESAALDILLFESEPTLRNAGELSTSLKYVARAWDRVAEKGKALEAFSAAVLLARASWVEEGSDHYLETLTVGLHWLGRATRHSSVTDSIAHLAEATRLLTRRAHAGWVDRLLGVQLDLGVSMRLARRFDESKRALKDALTTFDALLEADAESISRTRPEVCYELAVVCRQMGDVVSAKRWLSQALQPTDSEAEAIQELPKATTWHIAALFELGVLADEAKDSEGARQCFREAAEYVDRSTTASAAERYESAKARYRLGLNLRNAGDLEGALTHLQRACAEFRDLEGAHLDGTRRWLGWAHHASGVAHDLRDEHVAAARDLRMAIDFYVGGTNLDLRRCWKDLLSALKRTVEADTSTLADLRLDPRTVLDAILGDSSDVAATSSDVHDIALSARRQAAPLLAADLFEIAVGLRSTLSNEQPSGRASHLLALSTFELGLTLADLGAETATRRGLDALRAARTQFASLEADPPFPSTASDLSNTRVQLARILRREAVSFRTQGEVDTARRMLREALAEVDVPNPADVLQRAAAAVLIELAITVSSADASQALDVVGRAEALDRALIEHCSVEGDRGELVNALRWKAVFYRSLGREIEALVADGEADEMARSSS